MESTAPRNSNGQFLQGTLQVQFCLILIGFFYSIQPQISLAQPAVQLMQTMIESHADASITLARVKDLLESAESSTWDLNEKQEDGWSPLSLASAYGNAPLVQSLLKHGADPTQKVHLKDHDGRTKELSPLLLAVKSGDNATYAAILSDPRMTRAKIHDEVRVAIRLGESALAIALSTGFPLEQIQNYSKSDKLNLPIIREPDETECGICLQFPGSTGRIDIPHQMSIETTAICRQCAQEYCHQCITTHSKTRKTCPMCRSSHGFLLVEHGVPQLQWENESIILLPGESVTPASRPSIIPTISHLLSQPTRGGTPIEIHEFFEVPSRLSDGHRVFWTNADPDAVWTEPLRRMSQLGVLSSLLGRTHRPTLTHNLLKIDHHEVMSEDIGCFALNPVNQRHVILTEVVAGQAPRSGCYPPRDVDLASFRVALGYPSQFRLPRVFTSAHWMWTSSSHFLDNNFAHIFNGTSGETDNDHKNHLRATFCRCVGTAWRD